MLPRLITTSKQVVGGKLLGQWGKLFIDHMMAIDKDFDPGHRIDHVTRVTKTAVEIANKEGANLAVVLPAAILHDTRPVSKFGKERELASTLSADDSITLLQKWGYPEEFYPAIRHAIQAHSFSAKITPESLEAKVVQDADRLDAIGAIGVARTMAVGFKYGNPLYNSSEPFPGERDADDQTNILDHFYVKLFTLPDSLHTATAKEEGIRRIHTMETYLKALADEIGVEYVSYQNFLKKKEQHQMFRNERKRTDLICAGTLGVSTPEALSQMIGSGYRYFDLATAYKGSHEALAGAMQGMNRAEFNICTKINDGDLIKHNFSVRQILTSILKELNTNYLDTLMLHSPALLMHERAVQVFEELIKLKEEGLIKHIGVSNFTVKDLERLDPQYRKHIAYNEIEVSPYCQQNDVLEYCGRSGIQVMAYRPFGKGKADDLLENATLKEIANRHQASVQQVILAWLTQMNLVAIPKASSKEHLESNMAACNIFLSSTEMKTIATLDRNLHTCSWEGFVKLPEGFMSYADKPLVRPTTSAKGIFATNGTQGTNVGDVQPTFVQKFN